MKSISVVVGVFLCSFACVAHAEGEGDGTGQMNVPVAAAPEAAEAAAPEKPATQPVAAAEPAADAMPEAEAPAAAPDGRLAANPPAPSGNETKPGAVAPAGADPKIVSALDAFCKKWMGFLAVREHDNRAKISWKPLGEGVEGDYVGYGTEYACLLKDNPDPKAVPVATLKYREYLYRRRGSSADQAMLDAPDVLEATEVTEIFRYAKGEWVY